MTAITIPSASPLRRFEDVPVHELASAIVTEAERRAQCAVGLYMIDLDGTALRRVEGPASLPEVVPISGAVGPELSQQRARELREDFSGGVLVPLWLRHRAVAALIAERPPRRELEGMARAAAPALELAGCFSDTFAATRRRTAVGAASELQENLLPPRIAGVTGGELAAAILPAYEVGGDWFDYACTPTGVTLVVADATGKGRRAASVSALCVAAQRAARRNGEPLEDRARAIHEALQDVGAPGTYLTAAFANWHAPTASFEWVLYGHPSPLLVRCDGTVEELGGTRRPPLGVDGALEPRARDWRRLAPGDRMLLYSDGVTDHKDRSGRRVGRTALEQAVARDRAGSAASLVAAVHEAIRAVCADELSDDATVLCLGVRSDREREPPVAT